MLMLVDNTYPLKLISVIGSDRTTESALEVGLKDSQGQVKSRKDIIVLRVLSLQLISVSLLYSFGAVGILAGCAVGGGLGFLWNHIRSSH